MATLSISIPTYNRISQLSELVERLLSFKSDDIELVVTNNGSTDNTLAELAKISDPRLKVFDNENPVPGYYNMILGLFNASGKYVIHCNDRDLLFTERLPELLDFLNKDNYSYVQTTRGYLEPSRKVKVYEKGYESLLYQPFSNHPTGMVFNTDLMHKYLHKEDYLKYVDDTFTYSFLQRELLVYEKSARFDIGCWNERHSKIKLELSSGSVYKGGLYFEPDRITIFMQSVIKHIIGNPYFGLTNDQESIIILKIIDYFKKQLIYKKICYADNRECAHYGMNKQFVSVFQMKKIYQQYICACNEIIQDVGYGKVLDTIWKEKQKTYMDVVFMDCMKADFSILYNKYKRLTDKKYPY